MPWDPVGTRGLTMQFTIVRALVLGAMLMVATARGVLAQVAVIPLSGQVGGLLKQEVPIDEMIDSAYLRKALEYA